MQWRSMPDEALREAGLVQRRLGHRVQVRRPLRLDSEPKHAHAVPGCPESLPGGVEGRHRMGRVVVAPTSVRQIELGREVVPRRCFVGLDDKAFDQSKPVGVVHVVMLADGSPGPRRIPAMRRAAIPIGGSAWSGTRSWRLAVVRNEIDDLTALVGVRHAVAPDDSSAVPDPVVRPVRGVKRQHGVPVNSLQRRFPRAPLNGHGRHPTVKENYRNGPRGRRANGMTGRWPAGKTGSRSAG